jgi:hypothetical protein
MWRSLIADGLRMIGPISLVPKKRAQRCGQLIAESLKAPCSLAFASMPKKSAESFLGFLMLSLDALRMFSG